MSETKGVYAVPVRYGEVLAALDAAGMGAEDLALLVGYVRRLTAQGYGDLVIRFKDHKADVVLIESFKVKGS